MAKFDRFLLFSASLGWQWQAVSGNGRKLRKSIKGRKAKVVGSCLPPLLSDSVDKHSNRALICFFIAKQTSQLTPSPAEGGSVFFNNGPVRKFSAAGKVRRWYNTD